MRYLLQMENSSEQELRLQFLFDVFHVWFVPLGTEGGFIVFQSFPFSSWESNILIMYGHNYNIWKYLQAYLVPECFIYIISCMSATSGHIPLHGKCVYYDSESESTTKLMCGRDFGFDFDITDAELNLYNSKQISVHKKLNSAFFLSKTSYDKREDSIWTNSSKSSHLTISSILLFLEQYIGLYAESCTE